MDARRFMEKTSLFWLALIALGTAAIQNSSAGSAVAWDGQGHYSTAYGGPVKREKERALQTAYHKGWKTAKIIAATDMPGYGAIAIARHPNGYGSVDAVVIGKRSATEASTLAIERCLKAGGTNPQIKWAWKG
jgi:hypothetical protein